MPAQFDVFLSHNSIDKPWVTQLKDDLLPHDISVWLDQDEIRPGDLFVNALEQALDNCRTVALIISPQAINSGWVNEEYARAMNLAQNKKPPVRIIPVILRETELPGFLTTRNWVDFRDESQYEQSIQKLVWGITGDKPDSPPQIDPDLLKGHHFISYASSDGQTFALQLYDALSTQNIPLWLDKRNAPPETWDEALSDALKTCRSLIFVMTPDSVEDYAPSTRHWRRALKAKLPIIPIRLDPDIERPLGLGNRQVIEFADFKRGLNTLQTRLQQIATPAGYLQALKERLGDAHYDLPRAQTPLEKNRINADITYLKDEIARQKKITKNPKRAGILTQRRINKGLQTIKRQTSSQQIQPQTQTIVIDTLRTSVPAHFQGRVQETALVADFLKQTQEVLLIVRGRAGIGKTALVYRILKAVAQTGLLPDEGEALSLQGVIYLRHRSESPLDMALIYTQLLILLPETESTRLAARLKNAPASIEANMLALLQAFPQSDETSETLPPVVLLLDNFEDLLEPASGAIRDTDLDTALNTILHTDGHRLKLILTTRVTPSSLTLTPVGGRRRLLPLEKGLTPTETAALLHHLDRDGLAGLQEATAAQLTEVCDRTQGYPRALEALYALLAGDRTTTLADILADTENLLPAEVIEHLIGQAFERLDTPAQQVLQALALYKQPVPALAIDYMLQPYQAGREAQTTLRRLVNMQFVHLERDPDLAASQAASHTAASQAVSQAASHAAALYSLHPVDQAYALSLIPPGAELDRHHLKQDPPFTRFALYHLGANYFHQTRRPPDQWQKFSDLTPQLAEFELRYAGHDYDTAISILLEITPDYLLLWGYARLVVDLNERLLDKLKSNMLKFRNFELLGMAYEGLGRDDIALSYYKKAMGFLPDEGLKTGLLFHLGDCYVALGRVAEALDCYQESLKVTRKTKQHLIQMLTTVQGLSVSKTTKLKVSSTEIANQLRHFRIQEAKNLDGLGNCYDHLGQTEQAIKYHEQALNIYQEIGYRQGEASTLGSLGNRYAGLGQIERAIEYHEQALNISQEIGNRFGEGNALGSLGSQYADLGQIERAIEYHEQALNISQEIGDRQGEGSGLGSLSNRYADLGQIERAIKYHERALNIYQEIGHRAGESGCFTLLSALHIEQENYPEAIQAALKSIDIAAEVKGPASAGNANLALAYLYSDDLPAARTAIEAARQYDEPDNNHHVLALLGLITLRQDDKTVAQEAFEAAVAHAEKLLGYTDQNYTAWDTKGLALCGLALCEPAGDTDEQIQTYLQDALAAYQAARTITSAAGIVSWAKHLFEALSLADKAGVLLKVAEFVRG